MTAAGVFNQDEMQQKEQVLIAPAHEAQSTFVSTAAASSRKGNNNGIPGISIVGEQQGYFDKFW